MTKKNNKKDPSCQKQAETSNQIKELEEKILELQNGWQRTQADFDNYQKRSEEQKLNIITSANTDLMLKVTPVLDNFRRAFLHAPKNDNFTEGIKQIEKQLKDILKSEGLEKIPTDTNTKFDHNLHEAISFEVNDKIPADTIIDELESGWTYRGRVIKPTEVRVSKGK